MPKKFERRNDLIANNHFYKKKKHNLAKFLRETLTPSFNNLGSNLKGHHLLAMGWQNLAP
jgi:hypothetical protein